MSRWYDLFTSSEKRFADIGIGMLDVQQNESVLDIGCGTGYSLVKFADMGAKVIAIDLSEEMLKVAQRKIRNKTVDLIQADGLFTPFSDDQFKNIFISFALELFDTPEIPKVLEEIKRILNINGKLGVVSLAKQNTLTVRMYEWFHRLMPTLVDCRPIYLQPILKEAGFLIQKSTVKTMWGLPVEIATARK